MTVSTANLGFKCILPVRFEGDPNYNHEQILKDFGVEFQEEIKANPQIRFCRLPKDWAKRECPLEDCSELIDDKGRQRALIFVIIVDRGVKDAYLLLNTRYVVKQFVQNKKSSIAYVLKDGRPIYETQDYSCEGLDHRLSMEKALINANSWLDKNYPDWRNPAAYWED